MSGVHLVFPAGYDDPARPSGGNTYDRQLSAGLTECGWTVRVHEITHAWPMPDRALTGEIDAELAGIPDDRTVIVDGLLATMGASALVQHSARLRLVLLVHMPGPPGGPPAAVLHAARLVITTSEWTAETLTVQHRLTADRLLVTYPGVAAAELAIGTVAGNALLCVGAVTHAKGHDRLVAALAALAATPWSCTCVGALDREPVFVAQQQAELAARGIADRVKLTGPLVGAELEAAYLAADVLVLPTRLESYGLVVSEALAHGLPVIATAVGGVPEALGASTDGRRPGTLVPPCDQHALGQAIAAWLGNAELRDRLRGAARDRRATLPGWHHTAATVSAALHHLAAP